MKEFKLSVHQYREKLKKQLGFCSEILVSEYAEARKQHKQQQKDLVLNKLSNKEINRRRTICRKCESLRPDKKCAQAQKKCRCNPKSMKLAWRELKCNENKW